MDDVEKGCFGGHDAHRSEVLGKGTSPIGSGFGSGTLLLGQGIGL
jgi:hypothetical protein